MPALQVDLDQLASWITSVAGLATEVQATLSRQPALLSAGSVNIGQFDAGFAEAGTLAARYGGLKSDHTSSVTDHVTALQTLVAGATIIHDRLRDTDGSLELTPELIRQSFAAAAQSPAAVQLPA